MFSKKENSSEQQVTVLSEVLSAWSITLLSHSAIRSATTWRHRLNSPGKMPLGHFTWPILPPATSTLL